MLLKTPERTLWFSVVQMSLEQHAGSLQSPVTLSTLQSGLCELFPPSFLAWSSSSGKKTNSCPHGKFYLIWPGACPKTLLTSNDDWKCTCYCDKTCWVVNVRGLGCARWVREDWSNLLVSGLCWTCTSEFEGCPVTQNHAPELGRKFRCPQRV